MCGEDPPARPDVSVLVETPPRVWGRLTSGGVGCLEVGNTPTCVGKTGSGRGSAGLTVKHPHVCGEDPETAL